MASGPDKRKAVTAIHAQNRSRSWSREGEREAEEGHEQRATGGGDSDDDCERGWSGLY